MDVSRTGNGFGHLMSALSNRANREASLRDDFELLRGQLPVPLRLVVDELEDEYIHLMRRVHELEQKYTTKEAT